MNEIIFYLVAGTSVILLTLLTGVGLKKEGLGIGVFFVGMLSIAIFSSVNPTVIGTEDTHEVHLYSLKNSQETNGSFTLGSGSVETTEYYYYYFRTTLGFARGKVKVNDTYIVETDSRRPELVSIREIYSQDGFIKWQPDYEPKHYILYVPKNTVIQKFQAY